MPMRRRAFLRPWRLSALISVPFSTTLPEVGSTSRLMQRMRVLLPAPEEPITATTMG